MNSRLFSFSASKWALKNFNSITRLTKRTASGEMIPRPMENKYDVKGIGINVLRVGTGHNVLFLPGLLGTIWTDFSHQISGFNLNRYSLNIWDPPGHGGSRPPDRTFINNFYEKDAFIAAKLIETLNIAPCSLLGWSDGGITALILAAKYPNLVEKLVIWGTNSYITELDMKQYKGIQNISKWSPSVKQPMVEIYGEEKLQFLMNRWIGALDLICYMKKGDICTELIGDIKANTLILHGEKDPLVPYFHAKYLYERIKGARLHLFPEGKHNIHIKYATEFNEVVQEFLFGR